MGFAAGFVPGGPAWGAPAVYGTPAFGGGYGPGCEASAGWGPGIVVGSRGCGSAGRGSRFGGCGPLRGLFAGRGSAGCGAGACAPVDYGYAGGCGGAFGPF